MQDPVPFDDFRALLENRLDPASAARVRARLAADAALLAEFDDYAVVHAATATSMAPPKSALAFEKIDAARRAERIRRLRPWVAAAATILVGTGTFAAFSASRRTESPREVALVPAPTRGVDEPKPPKPADPTTTATPPKSHGTVTLRAISTADSTTPADVKPLPEPPAMLEDYRPVEGGRLRWIASIDDAYSMARWTGRPVLLWICMEQCPICVDLSQRTLVDGEVLVRAERYLPLRIEVTNLPKELKPLLVKSKGWPYFAALTPGRKPVAEFPGDHEPDEFKMELDEAWAKYAEETKGAAPVSWEAANELSAKLAHGGEELKNDRVGEAWRDFDEVARRAAGSAFAEVAKTGLARVARTAAVALAEAKRLSESSDPAEKRAGARSLSEAAERFRGTPFGTDLAEVEQELRATGRFPALAETR